MLNKTIDYAPSSKNDIKSLEQQIEQRQKEILKGKVYINKKFNDPMRTIHRKNRSYHIS